MNFSASFLIIFLVKLNFVLKLSFSLVAESISFFSSRKQLYSGCTVFSLFPSTSYVSNSSANNFFFNIFFNRFFSNISFRAQATWQTLT